MKPLLCPYQGSRATRLALALWVAVPATALPLVAQPLTGGPFGLIGAVVAGGGTASGGVFSIAGWAASAGAGTSSGESFDLTCGLLGIYVVPSDGVALRVELMPSGDVRMWWPADAAGYRLESTTAVGPGAVWQPVEPPPAANSYTTGPVLPARYFRLQKP